MGIAARVPSGYPNFDSVRWKLYLGGMGIDPPQTHPRSILNSRSADLQMTPPHFALEVWGLVPLETRP